MVEGVGAIGGRSRWRAGKGQAEGRADLQLGMALLTSCMRGDATKAVEVVGKAEEELGAFAKTGYVPAFRKARNIRFRMASLGRRRWLAGMIRADDFLRCFEDGGTADAS